MAGVMAQRVKHLPRKNEDLSAAFRRGSELGFQNPQKLDDSVKRLAKQGLMTRRIHGKSWI